MVKPFYSSLPVHTICVNMMNPTMKIDLLRKFFDINFGGNDLPTFVLKVSKEAL